MSRHLYLFFLLLLIGCAQTGVREKEDARAGFGRVMQEKTAQCKHQIETAAIPSTRSKIFWAAGLSQPSAAQLANTNYIQSNEKSELIVLNRLVVFCQTNYQKAIDNFFNPDYSKQFQNHLQWKLENLDHLGSGTITFGEYNRKEIELVQKLTSDLQFLDQRYRDIPPQPEVTMPSVSIKRFTNVLFPAFMLELLLMLPTLIL